MKTQSMFHAFDSIKELQDYVSRFNGNDAVVANIVMGITIETMDKIHDREMAQRRAERLEVLTAD